MAKKIYYMEKHRDRIGNASIYYGTTTWYKNKTTFRKSCKHNRRILQAYYEEEFDKLPEDFRAHWR